jgi:type IV pilus assembly protein PilV
VRVSNKFPAYCHSSGFTLLEALIAVLVLSFGLLGVAAMQLKAMQGSHVAYMRSIATLAAHDAVERLWVELGSASRTCPSPDSIEDDWINHWSGKLPGMEDSGSAVIATVDSNCEYKITVTWSDDRFASSDGLEDVSTLSYSTRLPGRE